MVYVNRRKKVSCHIYIGAENSGHTGGVAMTYLDEEIRSSIPGKGEVEIENIVAN